MRWACHPDHATAKPSRGFRSDFPKAELAAPVGRTFLSPILRRVRSANRSALGAMAMYSWPCRCASRRVYHSSPPHICTPSPEHATPPDKTEPPLPPPTSTPAAQSTDQTPPPPPSPHAPAAPPVHATAAQTPAPSPAIQ